MSKSKAKSPSPPPHLYLSPATSLVQETDRKLANRLSLPLGFKVVFTPELLLSLFFCLRGRGGRGGAGLDLVSAPKHFVTDHSHRQSPLPAC